MADLIKYAFVAGEISPTLFSRSDLEKYDLAVAQAENWFVDYRGGMSTRPGQGFVDIVKADDKPTKFIPFKFSPSSVQTYVLLLGDFYVRFIQNKNYILEADKVITGVTAASPAVVTSAGHGFANDDWVKLYDITGTMGNRLNGRTFKVAGVTANTFQLLDPLTGANISTVGLVYGAAGVAARIYTVVTPYAAEDLELLRAHQSRSVIYFTHHSYKTRTLTRVSDTSWTLAQITFGTSLGRPGTPTVDAGAAAAGVGFQITAVDPNGNESLPSDYGFDSTAVDYSSTAGQAKVTWSAVTGAVIYRVYRTMIIPTGAQVSRAMQVGFAGYAYGTEFIDANVIPDFAVTPPVHLDPFADGRVEFIQVTAGGAGYTNASVVSITSGTGTGFVGYAVVNSAGVLNAIAIVNGGSGYLSTDTVNVTVGAGATFTIDVSAASGNDPAVSSVFQQRKVYAGSDNDPLTIWASRPGQYEVMDVSTIIQEDDSYEFELDAEEVAPIRHLLATRSGLVIITQAGIWQLTGGQGVAVTPTNALADPQSYTGCSPLPPLTIDTDILYVEGKGATIRLLTYNDYTKVFAGQDLSILSNHLSTSTNPITAWTFASDPYKLVYATREDGYMLNLTLVKEQNIYGWTRRSTRGLYTDVLAIQEDRTDTVYFMVQRYVNGRWTKFIEYGASREFTDVEDAWCLDSALTNTYTYPAAGLTAAASSGSAVTFTADAAVFAPGDVDKVIRVGGGKAIVTSYTSATQVTCNIMRSITRVMPQDPDLIPLPALEGEWTLDAPITSVTGLWHLEGETVGILGDGSVQPEAVVTDGSVTLPVACSRIIIGLPYKCILQPLPPTAEGTTIEGKRKIIKGFKGRVYNSRALKAGTRLNHLYAAKERTDEAYAEPTRLQSGVKSYLLDGSFTTEGQFYIVQEDPLPATILGFVTDVVLGDVSSKGN